MAFLGYVLREIETFARSMWLGWWCLTDCSLGAPGSCIISGGIPLRRDSFWMNYRRPAKQKFMKIFRPRGFWIPSVYLTHHLVYSMYICVPCLYSGPELPKTLPALHGFKCIQPHKDFLLVNDSAINVVILSTFKFYRSLQSSKLFLQIHQPPPTELHFLKSGKMNRPCRPHSPIYSIPFSTQKPT